MADLRDEQRRGLTLERQLRFPMSINTTKDLAGFTKDCRKFYSPNPRKVARIKPNPEIFKDPVIRGYARNILDAEEKKATKAAKP